MRVRRLWLERKSITSGNGWEFAHSGWPWSCDGVCSFMTAKVGDARSTLQGMSELGQIRRNGSAAARFALQMKIEHSQRRDHDQDFMDHSSCAMQMRMRSHAARCFSLHIKHAIESVEKAIAKVYLIVLRLV